MKVDRNPGARGLDQGFADRVVPVAVREHQRIDAARIDAEPDDVALEDGLVWARVEQNRVM